MIYKFNGAYPEIHKSCCIFQEEKHNLELTAKHYIERSKAYLND